LDLEELIFLQEKINEKAGGYADEEEYGTPSNHALNSSLSIERFMSMDEFGLDTTEQEIEGLTFSEIVDEVSG